MATDVVEGREIGGDHILQEVDNPGIDLAVEPDRSGVSNRFIANNATLQPVHEDLSETASVEALMDYMVRSRTNQLDKWKDTEHVPSTAESPLQR